MDLSLEPVIKYFWSSVAAQQYISEECNAMVLDKEYDGFLYEYSWEVVSNEHVSK